MTARLATWCLALLVGLAPLWLGSNRPLPWAVNATIAGLVAIAAAVVALNEQRRYRLRFDLAIAPLVLWGVALGWAAFQMLPVGAATGLEHPVWMVAQSAGVDAISPSVSVNREATLASLMRLLTYASVFLAALVLGRNAERARFLLRAMIFAAVVLALYGLLRQASVASKILWFDEVAPHVLTATFINRNSAATYFGISAAVAIAFFQRSIRHLVQDADRERTTHGGFDRLISGLAGVPGLEAASFLLLLAAALLTQSRAGSFATILAILATLIFQMFRRLRTGGGFGASVAVVLVMFASLGILEMSGASVFSRLLATDVSSDARIAVMSDTLAAVSDHALLGSGLGTFPDIFPMYRSIAAPSDTIWDKAHNDYLEALLGLGIPAGTALILGVAVAVAMAMRGVFARGRNSHFAMAGAASGLLAGFHALFDFSLQIEAIAMLLALILGIAVAQSVSDRSR